MNKHDEFLKTVIEAIDNLQAERKAIDDKIAALELAYETISGGKPTTSAVKVKAKRKMAKKEITRDMKALDKTLAFVAERKRPTTVDAVANKFGIDQGAANQRLLALGRLHKVERVARGKYVAKKTASTVPETAS